MPFPTLQSGRVDKLVTNVLQAYTNQNFIAGMILPSLPVREESGKIGALDDSHLRVFTSKRSLYDKSEHSMEFKYTQDDSYAIEYYDLDNYVPDRLQNQLDQPFDAKRDAAFVLKQALMLEREVALATAMHNTAVITNNTTLSGTSQFNDFANSNPDTVIETARTTVQAATGREANSMYLSRKVFNTLKRHPFFLEMVKGVSVLTPGGLIQLMKDFFELENIYIGSAIKVSSKEGQAVTKTNVWSNDVVLFYKPSAASLYEPSFGYQFTLTGQNVRADVRRHTNDLGDILRVMWAYQDKILDTNCAYLIKDAVN